MSSDKNKESLLKNDLKLITIGNSGSNKTSFVNMWTKNIFTEKYKATIVSEFGFRIFEYDGKFYRIQLWDLAGQDRNHMVTKIFGKDADGVIIMCDATNIQTREETLIWKKRIEEISCFVDGGKLPIILVENKIDLLDDKEENAYSFKQFYEENGFSGGFRVSSKTGENVNESMEYLIINIIKRMEIAEKKRLNNLSEEKRTDFKINSKKFENKRCFIF